jgi:hypothetical protein
MSREPARMFQALPVRRFIVFQGLNASGLFPSLFIGDAINDNRLGYFF